MEALAQPGLRRAIVVVRINRCGRRVEIRDVEHRLHPLFQRDVAGITRKNGRGARAERANFVAQHRAIRHHGQRRLPPVGHARSVVVSVLLKTELDDLCRRISRDTATPLGKRRAVGRVVKKRSANLILVSGFQPDIDCLTRGILRRGIELQRCAVLPVERDIRRVVIGVGRRARAGVEAGAVAEREAGGADRRLIGLRAGRADDVSRRVARGEFFRRPLDEVHLLVAEKHIRRESRLIIALVAGRRAEGELKVDVHAAVEFHQHVFRRAVGARAEREIRAVRHARHRPRVFVVARRVVRDAVGIEIRIAVRPVFPIVGQRRSRRAILQNLDRGLAGVHVGLLRRAPRENKVAARRHDDAGELRCVGVEASAVGRVVEKIRVVRGAARRGKTRRETARLAARVVVVHHEKHRHAVGVGHGRVLAFVDPLVGHEVAVRESAELGTAGKLVVDIEQVRNASVVELPEERRVCVTRKRAAALAERLRLVVAIGVDQPDTGAREVKRVLQFAARSVVVVVALRVRDAERRRKPVAARLVESLQTGARIAENVVEIVAELVVHKPHSRIEIIAVSRRLAEMFAEHHRVVARLFRVEKRLAQIRAERVAAGSVEARVVEAARDVELPLRLTEKAVVVVILVRAVGRAEKIRAHVFHRVKPQAVGLRAIHQPARPAVEKILDVFGVKTRVVLQIGRGDSVARSKTHIRAVPLEAVVFRIVRLAQKFFLRKSRAFAGTEVFVRGTRLLRDVDKIGEAEMLNLPRTVPVARVVPFPVVTLGGEAQMEILGQKSGIDVDRRAGVVTRHVERIVVHDRVEINADAETVRGFDEPQQLGLRAVARAHRAALIFSTEVEPVEQIVADRQPA